MPVRFWRRVSNSRRAWALLTVPSVRWNRAERILGASWRSSRVDARTSSRALTKSRDDSVTTANTNTTVRKTRVMTPRVGTTRSYTCSM